MMLKLLLNNFHLIPLLPSLYFQGKKVKASVPQLPEAVGPEGQSGSGLKKLKLLCIGESTIAGVGVPTHELGFSGTLAKELSGLLDSTIQWKVIARSGYTAQLVNERLVPKIDFQPDLIVVGLGGNDGFQLNTAKKWSNDIRALISSLKSINPEASIFFTNMPPIRLFPAFTPLIRKVIGARVDRLGEALTMTVQEFDRVYFSNEKIDLETWSKRYDIAVEGNTFFSDGVHPSHLTYQVWAKDMAKLIAAQWSE